MEIVPYNGTTLAFIGDAVMTLWVRELLVSRGYQKPNDLQKMTSKYVSAKAQAYYLTQLIDKNFFDETALITIYPMNLQNFSQKTSFSLCKKPSQRSDIPFCVKMTIIF